MTTGPVLTEVQLPPKENGFTSSRLLSKIARSPTTSRRHQTVSSQGSDEVADSLPITQGAVHSRRPPSRPAFQRQVSAPDTFVPPLARDEDEIKHHSDATGATAQQAKAMLNQQPLHPASHATTISSAKSTGQGNMSFAPLVSEYYPQQQSVSGPNGVNYMYQQLYEQSQKRMATLQYMRKA